MDLLMAIALLCQNQVGLSKSATDAYQLKCQKEYLQCYIDTEVKSLIADEGLTEMAKQRKYLYQCVLNRKVKPVLCDQVLAK